MLASMMSVERPRPVTCPAGRKLHGDAAERVLALGNGVDGVKLERVRDGLDDFVDGVEGSVDGAVAQAHFLEAIIAPA